MMQILAAAALPLLWILYQAPSWMRRRRRRRLLTAPFPDDWLRSRRNVASISGIIQRRSNRTPAENERLSVREDFRFLQRRGR